MVEVKKLFELPPPKQLVKVILSEIVATLLLLLLGCMTLVGSGRTIPLISLGWGFIVGQIVMVFEPLSGSHINPIITISAMILGSINPLMALIYFISQFLGAFLGVFLLKSILPKIIWDAANPKVDGKSMGVCVTFPNLAKPWQAFILELFASAFLVFCCCHVHDFRTQHIRDSFPLKVAGVIMADVFCIAPFTGASMNPARSFGPALLNGKWDSHWVYWAGPILGSIVATVLYIIFWMPKKRDDNLDPNLVNQLLVALRKGPPESTENQNTS